MILICCVIYVVVLVFFIAVICRAFMHLMVGKCFYLLFIIIHNIQVNFIIDQNDRMQVDLIDCEKILMQRLFVHRCPNLSLDLLRKIHSE